MILVAGIFSAQAGPTAHCTSCSLGLGSGVPASLQIWTIQEGAKMVPEQVRGSRGDNGSEIGPGTLP